METEYPVYPPIGQKTKCQEEPINFPAQHQEQQPGLEGPMQPRPIYDYPGYRGSGKLQDQVAIITGGDSGIGRATAVAFAKEGANVAIAYLHEDEDAAETAQAVERYGRKCLTIPGDLRDPAQSERVVAETLTRFGKVNILVNNCAVQYPQQRFEEITPEQLENTFRTNIFSYFHMTHAALPHLSFGSRIINTSSVTAFEGNEQLIDYSATKGAIISFTRALARHLVDRGIRVNAVAPGPVWTPLIVSTFDAQQVSAFGANSLYKRAAQPFELAPAYVYLASDDSAYVTGQVLHVNGGQLFGG
ncbi:MAG: dehydrogenase, short-chain alcohol dehydrogenase like protein [Symbiobacteriaceae bacterium]|nr:dehydrogenase, short-chain alcohol dehydrogenase like protein [Symbiobacteriaceae bacterium]